MANTLRTRFGYLPSLGQHQRANASHLRLHRPAERAPKPNPPSQPRPRTRRAYHLTHAKGWRMDRHQRPPARRSWRNVRRARTLCAEASRKAGRSVQVVKHTSKRVFISARYTMVFIEIGTLVSRGLALGTLV